MKYIMKNFIQINFLLLLLLPGCSKNKEKAILKKDLPVPNKTLTIYTSHKEYVYIPIIREFEETTEIWVNIVTGGTNELLEKIKEEKDSPEADIMFGGGVESLNFYKDFFIPYKSEKDLHIKPYYLSKSYSWMPFSSLPIVIIYNPKLIKTSELKGWKDLLNNKFKGKIAFANPNMSASSFTAVATIIEALKDRYPLVLKEFTDVLDKKIFDNSKDIVPAVISGDYLIGITLEETALKAVAEEKNIAIIYPEEGTSCVPDGTAIIKGCRNLENARLFIEFTVNYQTQKLLERELYRRSVRSDIKTENKIIKLEDIPLISYDIEKACGQRENILNKWNTYIGAE